MTREQLQQQIINVSNADFDQVALALFRYQCTNNPVYGQFCRLVGRPVDKVHAVGDIPFLPIQLFRDHLIQSGSWVPEVIFESSGTTGQSRSRHAVRSLEWYGKITVRCFSHIYGDPSEYCWLALLPSYLERRNASLVYMVDHFARKSKYAKSGFFLDDFDILLTILKKNEEDGLPTILIGVSFALLDLAEFREFQLRHAIVMETGGMKGRRTELTRGELHGKLMDAFKVDQIHSEYGMTELLSQFYSSGGGVFKPCPTARVMIADLTDPLTLLGTGKRGMINVVDLANIDTCAFIATQDIGVLYDGGTFEVLGRVDESEMRGCNLMVADM